MVGIVIYCFLRKFQKKCLRKKFTARVLDFRIQNYLDYFRVRFWKNGRVGSIDIFAELVRTPIYFILAWENQIIFNQNEFALQILDFS